MSAEDMSESAPALLAVFAHPDDETFRSGGTLALLAQRGVRVCVLCATRGEAGVPGMACEEAGRLRQSELECACRALGIAPPRLLDYRDGTLGEVDEEEAVGRVLDAVRELRPQALLTWPPDGLSGHPDHVAVSRWTMLAFQQAATLERDAPMSLYHLVMPRSVAEALALSHLCTVPDEQITLAVDVTPVLGQKLAAIQCHQSQMNGSPILHAAPDKQRMFLGKEYFRLALKRPGPQAGAQEDPFERL